jgi:hypothetical protein
LLIKQKPKFRTGGEKKETQPLQYFSNPKISKSQNQTNQQTTEPKHTNTKNLNQQQTENKSNKTKKKGRRRRDEAEERREIFVFNVFLPIRLTGKVSGDLSSGFETSG